MYILETECSKPIYSVLLYPIKYMMNIILIVAPILLIISLLIIFAKGVINPDDSKLPKNIKNAMIAVFIIFFLSVMVNVVMSICGSNFKITECWNDVQKVEPTTKTDPIDNKDVKDGEKLKSENDQYD